MDSLLPRKLDKLPASRVELHVHLDGSVRFETIWELSKEKKLPLPGKGTFQDLREAVIVQNPRDLAHFLTGFAYLIPAIAGDLKALERIAFEFCEDCRKNGVFYVETRFCPQLLINEKYPEVNAEKILQAVLRGLEKGQTTFGIKARVILCCLIGFSSFDQEILNLCSKYRGEGVVGMDLAGDEASIYNNKPNPKRLPSTVAVFQEARKRGIHRTVHAGEAGPAESVLEAIEAMGAERIGHGYRVLENPTIYKLCCERKIHFETCPVSSYLTGSIPYDRKTHPVVKFAEDEINFSLNSDDTTVVGGGLENDYKLATSWGLNEVHFIRANFNAAKSSFLPENEKKSLLQNLRHIYGIE